MSSEPAPVQGLLLRVSMSRRSNNFDENLDMARIAGPVAVRCDPEETLFSIWRRFAEETDSKTQWTPDDQPHYVDFLDKEDRSIRGHGLFGVTDSGLVTMKDRWQDLRISEIQGAEYSGLYSGQFDHVEFLDHPPVGNGFWMDWDGLSTALHAIDEMLMIVGTISSAVTSKKWAGATTETASDLLLGRATAALEMVEEYRQQWESHNLQPEDIGGFLRLECVGSDNRKRLLGVRSEDSVEMLMELLNPELGSKGLAPIGRALLRFYYVETDELPARLALQYLEEALDAPADDLPSNDLFLKCLCPKDCGQFVEISSITQGVKFGFTNPTDHFVIRRSRLDELDDLSEYT